MTNSNRKDILLEWNRLNIENTEQSFISSLYQSISETTIAVDKFSLWLLAGTGATGALLISQIQSILPFLSPEGFKVCMISLVISASLGFVAKYKALRCEVQLQMQTKLQELLNPIFANHKEEEEKIKDYAIQSDIEIKTEISFSKIITELSKSFPSWVRLLMSRQLKENDPDRQAGHRIAFKAYMGQLRWTFFQATFYLVFMLSGAYYANII